MATTLPTQSFIDAVAIAMTRMLELRDDGTGHHSTEVVDLALAVGNHFGWSTRQLRELEISATLHDLGKIGIPDDILRKRARLEDAEMTEMKRHPEYGFGILKQLPGFEAVAGYILHHHERWDGTGYPGQLRGEEIPLGARIIAVVDAYHAMIEDRPYRLGMPREVAWQRLEESAGSQFDPHVVEVFVRYARQFAKPEPGTPAHPGSSVPPDR